MVKLVLSSLLFFAIVLAVYGADKIKVGIYKEDDAGLKTYGEMGIYETLKAEKDIEPAFVPEMSAAALKDFDVLIIAKKGWRDTSYKPDAWRENVRNWVGAGHGVMAVHEVGGCRTRHYKWDLFPEIAAGIDRFEGRELVMAVGHPLTLNAAPNQNIPNQVFRQGYNDYILFKTGSNGFPVAHGIRPDKEKNQLVCGAPVIVVGPYGQGRVMINGLLTGYDAASELEKPPVGAEKHLLTDGVRWLAARLPLEGNNVCRVSEGGFIGDLHGAWVERPDGLMREKTLTAEQLAGANLEFLKPILAKVKPPPLEKELPALSVGIIRGGNSARWQDALKGMGLEKVKVVGAEEIEQGLPDLSVLIIANAELEKKYVPVIDDFVKKGGKLLATEAAGYDRNSGKFNLLETLRAGTYLAIISVTYFQQFMPDEIKAKDRDPRRREHFIDRGRMPMQNGAAGMSYFTIDEMIKPERSRNWYPACKNPLGLTGRGMADSIDEVKYITRMSPLWRPAAGPALKNLPPTPQIGFFSAWPNPRDIDVVKTVSICKDAGINIIAYQIRAMPGARDNKADPQKALCDKLFARMAEECDKLGIRFWLNIAGGYTTTHTNECMVDYNGTNLNQICPLRGQSAYEICSANIRELFNKYPYLSGIMLDEPNIRDDRCFCAACQKQFAAMFPGGEMKINSDAFRKFREYLWGITYLKPYAELLREVRPQNGVLALAAPGIQKTWAMNADGMVKSGVQLFANENALTREGFDELRVKHELRKIPCQKLDFLQAHPVLEGIDAGKIGAEAVQADVFYGAQALAYVSDGKKSYPGIVAADDAGTIYFAFDPLEQPKFVMNTLKWFSANDRHDVPAGMAPIPAGNFKMKTQSDDLTTFRLPADMVETNVAVAKFYMDKYEVTNGEYEKYDPAHKRSELSLEDAMPVVNVSLADAARYCNWRSLKEGLEPVYTVQEGRRVIANPGKSGYRLPTVAEWQKAASGPHGYNYSWGNVWWRSEGRVGTSFDEGAVKVGSYFPNDYGIYDLTGNVWEWCEDRTAHNISATEWGMRICGGAWPSDATDSMVSFHNYLNENCYRSALGFRCVRNAAIK